MESFSDITLIAKKILPKYYLCDFCLGRLFSKKLKLTSDKLLGKKIKQNIPVSKKTCFICKDLFENIPSYLKKILDVSTNYEFSSFVIGAKIKPSIVDRDDYLKSKFQIRGVDGIKTGITHELSKQLSKKIKKRIDFLDPDAIFTIDLKEETCQIRTKQLFLQGRYTKTTRGLSQKQKPCENCSGKGCRRCDFHGIADYESVEGKISKILFDHLGGTLAKFTWVGGEDKSSLVLGSGRPFFVRLQNPLKRNIFFPIGIKVDSITINKLKVVFQIPKKPVSFSSIIEISISTENEIDSSLKKLKTLNSKPVVIYEKSGKRAEKKIFDVFTKKLSGTKFLIKIRVEGGFPVKRFVIGDNVVPGLSQTLNNNCRCEEFDFLEIRMITNN